MEIEETATKIKNMEIRGAGRIARAAATALKDFALQYKGNDAATFKIQLECAASKLTNTRPTAVSLSNAITFTLKGLNDLHDVGTLKQQIRESADNFIQSSHEAVEKIAELGSTLIPEDSVVLTHCNSSVVVAILVQAHKHGKNIKIYARETRPWLQGRITVKELAQEGVTVTLIVDAAAAFVLKKVDAVMVGADTIEANGNVVNKIGTSGLAVLAKEFNVPFYVCAETYKFAPQPLSGQKTIIEERAVDEIIDPDELPGVTIYNPVFDVTPAKYIQNIICEKGIISTSDVEDIIKNQFR